MKKNIVWGIRIVLSLLFLFSAFTKMYSKFEGFDSLFHPSIWMFEKTIVDVKLANWHNAQYLARFVLAAEIAAGFAILGARRLKSLVVPLMILLLLIFIGHLCYQIHLFGNSGNCGCFGQIIKMTPLEAIIKNVITVAMLVFVWFNVSDKEKPNNSFWIPFGIFIACQVFMFMAFPMRAATPETATAANSANTLSSEAVLPAMPIDTMNGSEVASITNADTSKAAVGKDTTKNQSATAKKKIADTIAKTIGTESKGPAPVVSKFAKHAVFAGSNFLVDQGKKILCFFAAGCDHCREKAKSLTAKKGSIPPVAILFLDEETEKIPDFFKEAGATYPYKVIDPATFFTIHDGTTPGVYAMWNGNILKSWEGIEKNEFQIQNLDGLWK
jgi:hypothetical protein